MPSPAPSPRRRAVFEVVFEASTPAGKGFDVAVILAILASVAVALLESTPAVAELYPRVFLRIEWGFTLLFTLEYAVRLWCVARPRRYATSFFGIVDLLAVLPTYLSVLIPGAQGLIVIRLVRLVRIFHVFNMRRYEGPATAILTALRTSRYPLLVFLTGLLSTVVFLGALMHVVEGPDAGFTSIPVGIYWAAVTLTTLGYGDLVPATALGRGLTTGIVLLGYWVLAVPVAIISVELSRAMSSPGRSSSLHCEGCGADDHEGDALHCRRCGTALTR
jgi:voltage-gated potassium channel